MSNIDKSSFENLLFKTKTSLSKGIENNLSFIFNFNFVNFDLIKFVNLISVG